VILIHAELNLIVYCLAYCLANRFNATMQFSLETMQLNMLLPV